MLSFGALLLMLAFFLLREPAGYSHRWGAQETYQGILAGILCAGIGAWMIISCKPLKTLRFPKTKTEKKKRIIRVAYTVGAYLMLSLMYTFLVPGGYNSPPALREASTIPASAAMAFIGVGIIFLPAIIFAYLVSEN